jgi:hypothetical protein
MKVRITLYIVIIFLFFYIIIDDISKLLTNELIYYKGWGVFGIQAYSMVFLSIIMITVFARLIYNEIVKNKN